MKHIVALSGGKDSTAMALRLAEVEPRDYVFVCTPTGDEAPEMVQHWLNLGKILGKQVLPVIGGTLDAEIERQQALPNWRQRWCTRILKIEPYARFLSALGECTSYVGLRADEEERQGATYLDLPDVRVDYPMRRWNWTLRDVRSYLAKCGIQIPRRTDCLKCFFQRLSEWYEFWQRYPEEWARGERQEEMTGHTFRSPGRDKWPASMKELRKRFEAGDRPPKSNDINQRCLICQL